MRLAPHAQVKASRTGMYSSRNLTQAVCGFDVSMISFPFDLLVIFK